MIAHGPFVCDHLECRSYCQLSAAGCKTHKHELAERGWVVIEDKDGGEKHYCPVHHPVTEKEVVRTD